MPVSKRGALVRQCSVDSVKPPTEVKIKPSITVNDFGQTISSHSNSGGSGSGGSGSGTGQAYDHHKHTDCIVFLVYCAAHEQVLLSVQQNDTPTALLYMPFLEVPLWNEAWSSTARYRCCQLLANNDVARFETLTNGKVFDFRCLQLLRLQLPATSKFVTRATYYFEIKAGKSGGGGSGSPGSASGSFACCQPIEPSMKWFPLQDIIEEKVKNLPDYCGQNVGFWGPELVELCKLIKLGKNRKTRLIEVSLEEITSQTTIRGGGAAEQQPRGAAEEELLLGLRLSSADVERMYVDYVDFCSPSYYLTPASFGLYLHKLGFQEHGNRTKQLFHAFNFTGSGRITFQELLIGMALYDPTAAPPNGPPRLKFVFRFYNTDQSGLLTVDQLKVMLAELSPAFQDKNGNKVKEVIDGLGPAEFPLSVGAFIKAVEGEKIPADVGAKLVHASKATFQSITRSIAIKNLAPNKKALAKRNIGNIIIKRHKNICPTCKSIKYDVASHAVTLKLNGEAVSRVLGEVVKPDVVVEKKKAVDSKQQLVVVNPDHLSAQQFSAEFVFNSGSVANVLLKAIREFSRAKGTVGQPRGLMEDRPEELWTLMVKLYRVLDVLLEKESKCQKVYSPCYIIGDIHGNLEDLLTLESTIWPSVPLLSANYLFLGDYVDRGKWSLETAVYLMAFKVLCPNKVTLLRGNHEVRLLQLNYSYKAELLRKYGEKHGTRFWELTNRLFDKMPVCALLDDAIYCAHGGIPKSAVTVDQINRLPREIRDPQAEAAIAWEILWSDPANRDDFNDTCAARSVDPETTNGFVFNLKRGTAFRFNQQAASAFLSANSLTHIVRAHEVIPFGYTFHFGAVCATIFSSSHYCGNDNDCCVILGDNQRLMVLHVDTAGNSTATN